MSVDAALVAELQQKVREGEGLRDAVERAGLLVRETLLDLQRNHREAFRQAKREQVEARRDVPEMEARALEILRAPEPDAPIIEGPARGR